MNDVHSLVLSWRADRVPFSVIGERLGVSTRTAKYIYLTPGYSGKKGPKPKTERWIECFNLRVSGLSTRQIGRQLGICHEAVSQHANKGALILGRALVGPPSPV